MKTCNNKRLFALLAAASLSLCLGISTEATITVNDLSQNVSPGVFTYTVQLDAAADVHAGDGFVIYDFPGLVSWSVTGGLAMSQFTLTQTVTSNVLTPASSVDANALVAAISNGLVFDSPAVPNLSFVYTGPPNPFLGAATATLTLTSSLDGGITDSVYGSVDHSGPNSNVPYSFSANAVSVPSSVPEPASLSLIGLAAGGLLVRRRTI